MCIYICVYMQVHTERPEGILCSLDKTGTPAIYNEGDEPRRHDTDKVRQIQRETLVVQAILPDVVE